MPKLASITIEGFRSIGDPLTVQFPENQPVILIGENNAGKSNIIRAIELMFGEYHPKYKKLENYDHYNRDPNNLVSIKAEVRGFKNKLGYSKNFTCCGFHFEARKGSETKFCAIQSEDGVENNYVSTDLRDELLCVVVNSEQNLNYQLSYSTKYTLLSKVTKAFHEKLVEDQSRVERLKGFFADIKSTFMEVEEFEKLSQDMSTIANAIMENMTHALEFDFSAFDPSNYFKTLRIHPTENNEIRSFEELGTGQQQILALSFAHAYAKSFLNDGLIFILDEPESHLHPLAQKWLSKKLFQMAKDGLQIVITTHSPYFVDLMSMKGIHLVRKDSHTTSLVNHSESSLYEHCISTGANPSKTSLETVLPFYANHSTPHILKGFFAKKVVLVEGLTEELALPEYFLRLGFDLSEFGVEIIGVGGKGNLAKWWRLFTMYQIPTFVCFDNDSRSDDKAGNLRKDALKAIGIPEENLEEVLNIDDWNVNDKFCVFGKDFEATMRKSFPDYDDTEGAKRSFFGSASKHIIARETAKELTLNHKEVGWQNFEKLKDILKALTI